MAMAQLWSDKKRTIFGLPLSFTRYTLTEEKFIKKSGILSTDEEEIRLYRIRDVSLHQTLGQRLFKVGTIHICSSDISAPELDVVSVKDPRTVKDLISDVVENVRNEKRVGVNEFMTEGSDFHDLMN
ncbi:MAG: PH domain-containing protein [Eubacterium sp.]|nr:PH domain-containing protein [Eubacterium sp.]